MVDSGSQLLRGTYLRQPIMTDKFPAGYIRIPGAGQAFKTKKPALNPKPQIPERLNLAPNLLQILGCLSR